jgi:signal transduction histidine kinase
LELRGDRLEKVRTGPVVDRPVYLLLRDPEGRLWCGTDDGVAVWDGDRLRHLGFRHGLVGRETNRGAGLVDHRGRLWIGTDQGVSIYRREYDLPPASPPAVSLAGLEVDGTRHPLNAAVKLDPDPGTLAFHPRVVAFSRPEEVRVRYRLDGFDSRWIGPESAAAVPIRYTNVPPGSYRFQVKAGWPDGPWSAAVTSATINIARPLWRRGWFLALLASTLGVLILGAHQLRLQAVRGRNRELEALNRQLEREVAERRRMEGEREELIADLEAKNVELERFTYTVSHDLKSPLVTIQGFLGLLRRDVEAGDAERAAHDAGRIESAAGRMGILLDELLELSRIGRVVHPDEPVPLDELVHETVQLLAGPIVARGAEVVVVDRGMPVAYGDRVRILEVFQNLIENALKFMGDQPEPRVEIGAEPRGDQVLATVRDNGVGIEPEYREKVFGLFERLQPELEGTGVGLAIVRRIVELHGGRIWVESEGAGRGATFRFTLPRYTSPARANSSSTPSGSRGSEKR